MARYPTHISKFIRSVHTLSSRVAAYVVKYTGINIHFTLWTFKSYATNNIYIKKKQHGTGLACILLKWKQSALHLATTTVTGPTDGVRFLQASHALR